MLGVFVWVAVLGPPVSSAVSSADPAACDGRVEGRVVDGSTAEPVFDARIRVDDAPGVLTDDAGAFVLDGVCPGAHTLHIERADYEPARRSVSVRRTPVRVAVTLEPRDIERLDDVVVQAPPLGASQLGASATLSGDALLQARGRGLAETIARLPGVSVLQSGSGAPGKPVIRGQFGRRNLILHDRVRHYAQSWGIDHAPELDPLSAGSITVIKGASGLQYGGDAIGGVVLIDPPPLPDTPGVSGMARLVGVSNGRRGLAAARVEGAHAALPGFAWRLEGNATRGAAPRSPDYPLDNTGASIWNAGGKVRWQRRWFSLEASARRHVLSAGLCSCLRNDTPEDFAQSFGLGRPVGADLYTSEYAIDRPRQHVTHDLAIARSRFTLGDVGELVATYAFQHNVRDEYAVVRADVSGPQFSFDLATDTADLVFDHDPVPVTPGVGLHGTAGVAFVHQRNTFVSNQTLIPNYVHNAGGLYLVERLVARQWEVHGGARYDGASRTATLSARDFAGQAAQGRLDPAVCQATDGGAGRCVPSFHTGSGTLGALVRPVAHEDHDLSLSLDLNSGARMPSVDEQFINGTAPSFPVLAVGSSRLGIERVWGNALTVAYDNPWLSTEAGAYVNLIDDYIDFRTQPQTGACAPLSCTVRGPFPVFAFQATRALFYGLDYGLLVAPPRWPVEIDARLALVRGRDVRNDRYVGFVPADNYALQVAYRWPDVWRFRRGVVSVQGTFVDKQRRYDLTTDFAPPPRAAFLLEAAASTQVPLGAQVLTLGLAGANLTNARYRQYTSLLRYFADEPGWEVSLQLGIEFTTRR